MNAQVLARVTDTLQDADATLTADGQRKALALLHRAEPIARAIIRAGETLAGPSADVLDAFVMTEDARARRAIPDPIDPNDEAARATALADAYYMVGVCVGALIAKNW